MIKLLLLLASNTLQFSVLFRRKAMLRAKYLMLPAITIYFYGLAVVVCEAQTNAIPVLTNWGPKIFDTQLSVTVSNNIVVRGEDITLSCWIKNSSSNVVSTPLWIPSTMNFYVYIRNSHNFIPLTPDPDSVGFLSRDTSFIQPGQTSVFKITLHIGREIQPDKYELITKRRVVANSKGYELISNKLDFEVTDKH